MKKKLVILPISAAFLGFMIAIFALGLDQVYKIWMLHGVGIRVGEQWPLLPFLDIVLVWNHGISYGLFQQYSFWGRFILIIVSGVACIAMSVWLLSAKQYGVAVSLGLIIGGALGNMIDRIAYGAVADFFLFHIGSFQWYVFNLADVWIVIGAGGLLYDTFFGRKTAAMDK